MKPHEVILHPLTTEEAILLIEKENKIVFIVNLKATKRDIKQAVEQLFKVKVQKVNTMIAPDGRKKAYVKLMPEHKASDLAVKLGIL